MSDQTNARRGYAADPLQEQKDAIEAALFLGLVWSGVHVIPDLQGGQSWRWIVGQRSFSVALRVLIVWLYNNTGRTLTAPVLFHASDNVSVFTLFPGDSEDQYNPAIPPRSPRWPLSSSPICGARARWPGSGGVADRGIGRSAMIHLGLNTRGG